VTGGPATGGDALGRAAAAVAISKLGGPYVVGADGPTAFDCSGLTQYAWAAQGIHIPDVSYQQDKLPAVPLDQLLPGDLVTYYRPTSHVAMYIGNGNVASASSPEIGIVVRSVERGGAFPMGHRVPRAGGTPVMPESLTTTQPSTVTGNVIADPNTPAMPMQIIQALPALPQPRRSTGPVRVNNRLSRVLVSGVAWADVITDAVISATMHYSTTQTSEFAFVVADSPDGKMLNTHQFDRGVTIDVGEQHLDVRGFSTAAGPGSPQLQVKARSRVVSALQDSRTTSTKDETWGTVDVYSWVTARVREAGGRSLVQPSLGALTINRATGESTVTAMARAAASLGCWMFEYEQLVVFGKPSWLVGLRHLRKWPLAWWSWTNYTRGLTGQPVYTWSADRTVPETLSFSLISDDAELIRPGELVTLSGNMGPAVGHWIVTDVSIPYSRIGPTAVTCLRPIDPPRGA